MPFTIVTDSDDPDIPDFAMHNTTALLPGVKEFTGLGLPLSPEGSFARTLRKLSDPVLNCRNGADQHLGGQASA